MDSQTYQMIGAGLMRKYHSLNHGDEAKRMGKFIEAYEAAPFFKVGFSPTRNYEYDDLCEVFIQPEHITRLAEGHIELDNIRMPFPHALFEIPVHDYSIPNREYYRRVYDDGVHPLDPGIYGIEPVRSFEADDAIVFNVNSRALASVHEISPQLLHIEVIYFKSSKNLDEKMRAATHDCEKITTEEMIEINKDISHSLLLDAPVSIFSSLVSPDQSTEQFENFLHYRRNPWADERFAKPEDYRPFLVMPLVSSSFHCSNHGMLDAVCYDFQTQSPLFACKRFCSSYKGCKYHGSRSFNWAERILSILTYINQPQLYIIKESKTVNKREQGRNKNKRGAERFLNKARYLVLDYSQVKTRYLSAGMGGTHASPLPHLRRAHPRRLKADRFKEKKTIQVKSCEVNKGMTWSDGKRIYEVI